MKNSSKSLALSLVLFLVTCTTITDRDTPSKTPEEIFLAKVLTKTMFQNSTLQGVFNTDGKEHENSDGHKYALDSVTDKNTGVYKSSSGDKITIVTTDGITGTQTSVHSSFDFVLKTPKEIEEEKTFLAKVLMKTMFQNSILQGVFNTDGKDYEDSNGNIHILDKATDKDTGIYTNSSNDDKITITTTDGITGTQTSAHSTFDFVFKTPYDVFILQVSGKILEVASKKLAPINDEGDFQISGSLYKIDGIYYLTEIIVEPRITIYRVEDGGNIYYIGFRIESDGWVYITLRQDSLEKAEMIPEEDYKHAGILKDKTP